MKIEIRPAREEDLEDLCRIRYADRPELHLKRIQQSRSGSIFYLAAEIDGQVKGFGLLLLKAPSDWLDERSAFPRLIDLFVSKEQRSQGMGRALIEKAEEITWQNGFTELNLSVAPLTNPRAHQLYRRLGYFALQEQPYLKHQTTDSDGRTKTSDVLLIDMRKELTGPIMTAN